MRAAISLLVLLFSMCGAQTQSTQTEVQTESQGTGAAAAEVSTQLDVSAELKELRDMVVEQGVMLRYTQEDLYSTTNEVKVLEAENEAVKSRLAVAETEVTHLKTANGELKTRLDATEPEIIHLKFASEDALAELEKHAQELAALKMENGELKTRLVASEAEVKDLKMDSAAHEQELAALKTRMAASETATDNLKVENAAQEAELTAVKTRLAATETGVENLENEIRAAPKLAFSAGLGISGTIESGGTDLNLVFSKVITNVGEAYNNVSGFFTAPVRGVYYFRFTVVDVLHSRTMHISMRKNGQQLMRLSESDTDGYYAYLSSGLTLQLEKGDVVNMVLPAGYRLYDDSDNRSSFSGFLLFPL